jgi:hypothetical protein
VDEGIGRLAFYGRCSIEDNQDPETSLGWQLSNARKFVGPLGGTIVAEFFDVGQSRSVPWERRMRLRGCWLSSSGRIEAGTRSSWVRGRGAGSATSSR